jgi:hypothetical protein
VCLRVPASSHKRRRSKLSEQDTTLTDDQIRAESTWEETPSEGGETEEGDSDGMDTGGGSDSDSDGMDSDSDGSDSDSDGTDS